VVLDLLGQGTFGQVVKCRKLGSDEVFAVKIIKSKRAYFNQGLIETKILEKVSHFLVIDSSAILVVGIVVVVVVGCCKSSSFFLFVFFFPFSYATTRSPS